MLVLPNRRCGRPAKGGLYAVGRKSVFGTLKAMTCLPAPLPAEVANPRKPEVVDTARTLCGIAGLVHPDPHVSFGRFARLPRVGLADFWGQSAGYRSTWDCIEETQRLGVCRRVANVFSVPLPCPVLMLHAEAVVDAEWQAVSKWLHEREIVWWQKHIAAVPSMHGDTVTMDDQPWREASSLARKDDDDFMWHSYVGLWRIIPELRKRRLFAKFGEECGVRFEEGIFGISWISDFCHVLEDDEAEVPAHLAEKGVIAAVAEDDVRAHGG